jgi:electron-transferring-flavoprotein dehydrogenase
VLTGSGVDEAWTTGAQLAEAVLELLRESQPLTKENLERAYVARRRASWVEEEGIAEKARDGFHRGVVTGLLGMALAGITGGKRSMSRRAEAHARRGGVLPREDPRRRAPPHRGGMPRQAACRATTR